jgi:D-glycero-D-manno-heptose 1,7-bisphosphate phosphatase
MLNKAVFLDRDGVINFDYGYVHQISNFDIIPGVFDAMKLLHDAGYKLIVITNQAGIARGLYNTTDYENLTKHMVKLFARKNINFSGIYHCPHHPNKSIIKKLNINCNCRKPRTGMIQKAENDHKLNLQECWLVGDKLSDIQAGNTSKLAGNILVNPTHDNSREQNKFNYFLAENLLDASRIIVG